MHHIIDHTPPGLPSSCTRQSAGSPRSGERSYPSGLTTTGTGALSIILFLLAAQVATAGEMLVDLGPESTQEYDVKPYAARIAADGDATKLGISSAGQYAGQTNFDDQQVTITFTPERAGIKMVAFSDDGVTVFIRDVTSGTSGSGGLAGTTPPTGGASASTTASSTGGGTKVLNNKTKGQALPNLGESLKDIEFTFELGHTYEITVDYINTLYTGGGDVDGAQLIAYGGEEGGSGGSGGGGGNGNTETGPVDLVIYNGQGGEAVPAAKEETVGAFTVANLNDTDSSQSGDNTQTSVPGEKDLMKLELTRPTGAADTDDVTLTIGTGVKLWKESTKETAETNLTCKASDLPKTLWVEATGGSVALRDIQLSLTCNGMSDTVKATAIWATLSGFRNENSDDPPLTLADAADSGDTTITVAGGTFVAGDHIVILSAPGATPQKLPEGMDVVSVNGSTLTVTPGPMSSWPAGSEVRFGMSREIDDNPTMVNRFVEGGGKLGSAHVSPRTNNAMEMQFTVGPPGIGKEPGIKFDITRQKESLGWTQDFLANGNLRWDDLEFGDQIPSNFPAGDEVPNDDGPFTVPGQQDEDNTPNNDQIYSRDMPGMLSDQAQNYRRVIRYNMKEFVRVKLDSGGFDNLNYKIEGSRCSDKVPWYSRMDLIRDNATGKWTRNGTMENEIKEGRKNLLPAPQ